MKIERIKYHGKRITKNDHPKPVLKGIFYDDNSATATDSRRAFRISTPTEQTQIINPVNDEVIDGQFPDMERIFNQNHDDYWTMDDTAIKALRNSLRLKQSIKLVKIELTETTITVKYANHEIITEQPVKATKPLDFAINPHYLKQALDMAIEMGEPIRIEYGTNIQPFVVKTDSLEYLVLPIRTY